MHSFWDTFSFSLDYSINESLKRAVFGEVYPDPVRVVSVANSVEGMVEDPANEDWGLSSVEFCGGTHVSNTKDAEAFVITEETAVAKGVRRITGVTRGPAKEAGSLGRFLVDHLVLTQAILHY